jgi:hypothetical protein
LASRKVAGIAVTLLALLVVGATDGAYLYNGYQQASQTNARYLTELSDATSQYVSLASGYNSSLALYNETFSLLVQTIGSMNTSLPAYRQASAELSQLWSRYLALKPASASLYSADFLVDFGNGTRAWHNATLVQPGWSAYTATVVLSDGRVQAQWYPEYQEHLVSSIYGVPDTPTQSWFLWDFTTSWQLVQVGADQLHVFNGSVIAWTFCGESADYSPDCTP